MHAKFVTGFAASKTSLEPQFALAPMPTIGKLGDALVPQSIDIARKKLISDRHSSKTYLLDAISA